MLKDTDRRLLILHKAVNLHEPKGYKWLSLKCQRETSIRVPRCGSINHILPKGGNALRQPPLEVKSQ